MVMKQVKMVIYDCDGVIFDSEKANLEYYSYIFKKFNLPQISSQNIEHMRVLHTYSNDEVFKYFVKDKKLQKDIIIFSKTVDYSIFYKYMKLEKDFFKCCEILKKKNLKIGVATNRSISFAGIMQFFHLNKFLDDYVTTLDVKRPKPYPDMLNLILEKNNLKPFEAIFVGDSLIDYKAATLSGIKFIGYKIKVKNELCIENHLELIKIFERIHNY